MANGSYRIITRIILYFQMVDSDSDEAKCALTLELLREMGIADEINFLGASF